MRLVHSTHATQLITETEMRHEWPAGDPVSRDSETLVEYVWRFNKPNQETEHENTTPA